MPHAKPKAKRGGKNSTRGRASKAGDSNALVDLRRSLVAEMRYLRGMTYAQILEALMSDSEKRFHLRVTDEHGAEVLKELSEVTIRQDVLRVKKRYREETELVLAEHRARQFAELQMVKTKAAVDGEWASWLRANEQEMELLGTKAPKDIRIVNDALKQMMLEAVARIREEFKGQPQLRDQILAVLAGRPVKELMRALPAPAEEGGA
jgi:hypothetical protein